MASESTGVKDQPYFASNGAPEIDVDPGIVADYAALTGNRKVGSRAERLLLTGKKVWGGLSFYETDFFMEWVIPEQGGDWILSAPEPWRTPTLSGGITVTPGRLAPKYRKIPGGVELQGSINGSSGSGFSLFTLPTGYAPAGEVRLWASLGGSIQVLTNGQVNSTLTGTKALVDFNGFYPLS